VTFILRWIDGLSGFPCGAREPGRCVLSLLFVIVILVLICEPAMAKLTCNPAIKNYDGVRVSEGVLTGYGYKPGTAQFGSKISGAEGGFNSVNCYGCVGFIQWCPGTFEAYFGYSYLANPIPSRIPAPATQAAQAKAYWANQWKYGKNYLSLLGHEVCVAPTKRKAGGCVTVTQSSILFACQFGCAGSKAKIAGYVNNGFSCSGTSSARDGNGVCVELYLYRGAGYDVSEITGMTSDELNAIRRSDGKIVNDPTCGKDGENSELVQMPASACASVTGTSGVGAVAPPPKCSEINLMGGITLAQKAYQNAAIAAGQNVYKDMKVRNLMQCILNIKSYFSKIQALLSSVAGAIGALILQLLGEFFKMVCDYIIKTIENLMQMVCVPVPNLGFSLKLDMPSLQSASCDGLSLADFISINGHGGTFPAGMPALSINNMSLGTELFRKRSQ